MEGRREEEGQGTGASDGDKTVHAYSEQESAETFCEEDDKAGGA